MSRAQPQQNECTFVNAGRLTPPSDGNCFLAFLVVVDEAEREMLSRSTSFFAKSLVEVQEKPLKKTDKVHTSFTRVVIVKRGNEARSQMVLANRIGTAADSV